MNITFNMDICCTCSQLKLETMNSKRGPWPSTLLFSSANWQLRLVKFLLSSANGLCQIRKVVTRCTEHANFYPFAGNHTSDDWNSAIRRPARHHLFRMNSKIRAHAQNRRTRANAACGSTTSYSSPHPHIRSTTASAPLATSPSTYLLYEICFQLKY